MLNSIRVHLPRHLPSTVSGPSRRRSKIWQPSSCSSTSRKEPIGQTACAGALFQSINRWADSKHDRALICNAVRFTDPTNPSYLRSPRSADNLKALGVTVVCATTSIVTNSSLQLHLWQCSEHNHTYSYHHFGPGLRGLRIQIVAPFPLYGYTLGFSLLSHHGS